MAKANTVTVEEKVEVTRRSTAVVLTLTEGEAQFLRDVLANVGGSPHHSRRCHERGIAEALNGCGTRCVYEPDPTSRDFTGYIYFKDIK